MPSITVDRSFIRQAIKNGRSVPKVRFHVSGIDAEVGEFLLVDGYSAEGDVAMVIGSFVYDDTEFIQVNWWCFVDGSGYEDFGVGLSEGAYHPRQIFQTCRVSLVSKSDPVSVCIVFFQSAFDEGLAALTFGMADVFMAVFCIDGESNHHELSKSDVCTNRLLTELPLSSTGAIWGAKMTVVHGVRSIVFTTAQAKVQRGSASVFMIGPMWEIICRSLTDYWHYTATKSSLVQATNPTLALRSIHSCGLQHVVRVESGVGLAAFQRYFGVMCGVHPRKRPPPNPLRRKNELKCKTRPLEVNDRVNVAAESCWFDEAERSERSSEEKFKFYPEQSGIDLIYNKRQSTLKMTVRYNWVEATDPLINLFCQMSVVDENEGSDDETAKSMVSVSVGDYFETDGDVFKVTGIDGVNVTVESIEGKEERSFGLEYVASRVEDYLNEE